MAKPKASTIGTAYPSAGFCLKLNGKLEMTRDRNAIGLCAIFRTVRLLKNENFPISTINKFKFKILLS